MSKNQRVDEGRLEADHGEMDYRDSSDDEEVRLGYFHTGRVRMSMTHRERISMMGQKHRTHNEMNGYSRRSLFRGLARGGIKGSDLQ